MTLVNKINRFQAYNPIPHYLYVVCVFTTSSQVSFHHHLFSLYPLLPPPTLFPLVITILVSVSMRFPFLNPFTFFTQLCSPHSDSCLSVFCIYKSVSILFILFITFHMEVKSYGTCLSMAGLFDLA